MVESLDVNPRHYCTVNTVHRHPYSNLGSECRTVFENELHSPLLQWLISPWHCKFIPSKNCCCKHRLSCSHPITPVHNNLFITLGTVYFYTSTSVCYNDFYNPTIAWHLEENVLKLNIGNTICRIFLCRLNDGLHFFDQTLWDNSFGKPSEPIFCWHKHNRPGMLLGHLRPRKGHIRPFLIKYHVDLF